MTTLQMSHNHRVTATYTDNVAAPTTDERWMIGSFMFITTMETGKIIDKQYDTMDD
jgi:hypothetical protein